MKKQKFEFLLDELKLQTNFAIISINRLEENLNEKSNASFCENRDLQVIKQYEFWYYIQNYVISLGNISKILFVTKSNRENKKEFFERKIDRDFFLEKMELPEKMVIRNKKMRNTLEHIDEKIEIFSLKPQNIIANRNIGPSNMIMVDGKSLFDEDSNNLRNFLTDKNEFVLFGEKFNISQTFGEVLLIRDKIIEIQNVLEKGEMDDLFS